MSVENYICGDSRKNLDTLVDGSVSLIILDPPYLVTSKDWDREEVVDFNLSEQLFRVASDSCSLYVWCGIGEKSQSLIRWFPIFSKIWHFKDLITWAKDRGIGMRRGWLYTREEIMWFVKDNSKFVWNKEYQYSERLRNYNHKGCRSPYKRLTNVWNDIHEVTLDGSLGKDSKVEGVGFVSKPMRAIERIVLSCTEPGDTVLDPFFGLGTTGIVCRELGRGCIGIEKDPEIYVKAMKRLEEFKRCQL